MKSCGICFCYMRVLQKSDTTGETSTSNHQLRWSCTAEHLSSIKHDDDAIQLLNWHVTLTVTLCYAIWKWKHWFDSIELSTREDNLCSIFLPCYWQYRNYKLDMIWSLLENKCCCCLSHGFHTCYNWSISILQNDETTLQWWIHFLFIFSSAEVEGVNCEGLITLQYGGVVSNQIDYQRAVDSSTDDTKAIGEFDFNKQQKQNRLWWAQLCLIQCRMYTVRYIKLYLSRCLLQ